MDTRRYSFGMDVLGMLLICGGVLGAFYLLVIEVPIVILGVYSWTAKWPAHYDAHLWWRACLIGVPWFLACAVCVWSGRRVRRIQRARLT